MKNDGDKLENNIGKLLLLLDRNLTEKFYIMKHDIEHLYFVTASLKGTGGLDGNANDDSELFSNLERQVLKSKNFTVKLVKNYRDHHSYSRQEKQKGNSKYMPDKDEIFNFNKMLVSHSRALSILSRQLDYLHKTISETSYSLPPVIEPIRKYKRKIDRDDLIVLKNILSSYKKRLISICNLLKCNHDEAIDKMDNSIIIFIDYSAGTKFFEAAATKVINLGIIENHNHADLKDNDKDYNLEFIRLPYWAVKITEYVSAVAHEIVHLYLHKHKAEQNEITEINTLKNKIVNKLSYILADYYGVDEDTFIEMMTDYDLMEILAEEIIADTLSLLIAGPSYYFTLFSQNISRYPFTPDIIYSSPLVYARIYALYYIIQNTIKNDNRKGSKVFTKYWKEMFHFTKIYLDAITDENAIRKALIESKDTENNFESVEQIVFKMGIQEDIGKTIAEEILLKFFQEESRIGNLKNKKDEKNDKEGEEKFETETILSRLESTNFMEIIKDKEVGFVNVDLFTKTLLNIKDMSLSFFKENIGDIPEYLWDISLYYFYNYDESKQNNENDDENFTRLPKLQVARLLGIKQRRELFSECFKTHSKKLHLSEPEEWLFAKVDWMQVKRIMNNNREKNLVDYFRDNLSVSYDLNCKESKKINLQKDFILGDYDFLLTLEGASTRRCLDWPPMLEYEDGKEGNKKYCAPYTYKEYIVERVTMGKCSEEKSKNDSKKDNSSSNNNPTSNNPSTKNTGRSYILKFIKLLDIDEATLINFIQRLIEDHYEVYLSNSWNTLFIKKYLDGNYNVTDMKKKMFEVDNLIKLPVETDNKQKTRSSKDNNQNNGNNDIRIEDIQTFIAFQQRNKTDDEPQDKFKFTTMIKTRGTAFVKKEKELLNINSETPSNREFLEINNGAIKKIYHLSGISDYMIEWQNDSISKIEDSLKELIDKLSNIGKNWPDSYFSILTSFIFFEDDFNKR